MSVKFEGKPPFYLGIAEVASAHALDGSVVLRATISVPELRPKSVPVQFILAIDVAKALAEQLPIAVRTAELKAERKVESWAYARSRRRRRPHARGSSAQFAADVLAIIRDIQAAGFTSLNAIAGQLNARKVATANGGQWRHVQVRHILDRAPAPAGSSPAGHQPLSCIISMSIAGVRPADRHTEHPPRSAARDRKIAAGEKCGGWPPTRPARNDEWHSPSPSPPLQFNGRTHQRERAKALTA